MTLAELLKSEGFTDEQIKTITGDPKLASTMSKMQTEADRKLAAATEAQKKAEEKEAKVNKWWEEEATPQINDSLSAAATEKARAQFYQTQAEEAKKAGFIPADAPGFDPAKKTATTTTTTTVPGSPDLVTKDELNKLSGGVVNTFYITQELSNQHFKLFGEPLIGLEALVKEAQTRRIGLTQMWEEKFKVPEKRAEIAAAKQKEHDDAIVKATEDRVKKELAEANGSNGSIARPVVSQFSKFTKGAEGSGRDKLAWANADKKAATYAGLREKAVKQLVQ